MVSCPLGCETTDDIFDKKKMKDHIENKCKMVTVTCQYCKDEFQRHTEHNCSVQKIAFQVYRLKNQMNQDMTVQVKALKQFNKDLTASEEEF